MQAVKRKGKTKIQEQFAIFFVGQHVLHLQLIDCFQHSLDTAPQKHFKSPKRHLFSFKSFFVPETKSNDGKS